MQITFPEGVAGPLLAQLAFYALVLLPVAALLARGTSSRDTRARLLRSLAVLGLLASMHWGWTLQRRAPNHYALFGVGRDASAIQIRKAFKKLKLQHSGFDGPNPLPPKYQRAYNILMDLSVKHLYDKFGPAGVTTDLSDEASVLAHLAVFPLVWGAVTMLTTASPALFNARNYGLCLLIGLLMLDLFTVFESSSVVPTWALPRYTEFELRAGVKTVFPLALAMLQAWCWSQYQDVKRQGTVLCQCIADAHYRRKLGLLTTIVATLRRLETGETEEAADLPANGQSGRPASPRQARRGEANALLDLPVTWDSKGGRWKLYAAVGVYAVAFHLMKQAKQ